MLPKMISSEMSLTSTLFLLGALSGAAAFGVSFFAQAQERTGATVSKRSVAGSGRRLATVLLALSYLAMAGALLTL